MKRNETAALPNLDIPSRWWGGAKGHSRGHPPGFSLVEVLISAAILCIAIVAVVAMVRKGGDLQVTNDYRLKARAALNARFETLYNQANYQVIADMANDSSITYGDGPGGNPLVGKLYTTIETQLITVSETPNIPVKKVTLALAWDTFDGERDSILISKWLTE